LGDRYLQVIFSREHCRQIETAGFFPGQCAGSKKFMSGAFPLSLKTTFLSDTGEADLVFAFVSTRCRFLSGQENITGVKNPARIFVGTSVSAGIFRVGNMGLNEDELELQSESKPPNESEALPAATPES
jgi:hypothetical protein